ncbi:hypothetical protein AURDEDRAFT_116229 [Auricularia subglabra TFB-10046 SS5]|nr:hypothetical protein AURDEDRAFT_116229 [Auricularia subglabra TFB-10046 SS5]
MWTTLATRGAQAKPADRFSALGTIVALQQEPDESLLAYHARCKNAVAEWVALLPASYTIKELKSELACWCTLRGLDDQYSAFSSNVVNGLEISGKTLDMDSLRAAFNSEQSLRQSRQLPAAAMRAAAGASGTSTPLSTTSTAVDEGTLLRAFAAAGKHTRCWICDSPEHLLYECPRRDSLREKASEDRKASNKKSKKKKSQKDDSGTHAHAASSTPAAPAAPAPAAAPAAARASLAAAIRSLNGALHT